MLESDCFGFSLRACKEHFGCGIACGLLDALDEVALASCIRYLFITPCLVLLSLLVFLLGGEEHWIVSSPANFCIAGCMGICMAMIPIALRL